LLEENSYNKVESIKNNVENSISLSCPLLVILFGVLVAAAHGLVEELDGEHAVAIVLDEVPDIYGMHAGERPLAVVKVHLTLAVEQHVHEPHAGHTTGHTHNDVMGLLPIDDRCELLGKAQPILGHSHVDGDAKPKPKKSMVMGSGDDGGDAVAADSGFSHHTFLGDIGLGHA
jgi:hypothetical protein